MTEHREQEIRQRVEHQLQLEIDGDVDGLYEIVDPAIRATRESERTDEPELTRADIDAFVREIESAELQSFAVAEWATCRDGTPAAVVEVAVLYNARPRPDRFRTIWVQRSGLWYSTALNKRRWFREPKRAE